MPATIDNRANARGVIGKAGFLSSAANSLFVLEKTLNYATNVKADGTAYTNTAGDTLQLLDVPANTVVLGAWVLVETVMGSAGTMTLGDGDDADGYIVAIDLNATGVTAADGVYLDTAAEAVSGKVYTSAGVISGLLGGTLTDAGIIHITVLCLRLGA